MSANVIEAMLLRWGDNHNGRTVTLQLPPEGDHPFRGLKCGPANGQRLALSVALIADDETTAPHETPSQPSEKPASGGNGSGAGTHRLSQRSALRCQDARFQRFLAEQFPNSFPAGNIDDAAAADFVRHYCIIQSRSEIDGNPEAERRWKRLDALYIAWREAA